MRETKSVLSNTVIFFFLIGIILFMSQCGCCVAKRADSINTKQPTDNKFSYIEKRNASLLSDMDSIVLTLKEVGPKTIKGKVVLKKHYGNNRNHANKPVLDQSNFVKTNTSYVIKHDFDLMGRRIILPEDCELLFEGGSLNNGILIGNNTSVSYSGSVFKGISIGGNWDVPVIHSSMFVDATTCINRLQDVIALSNPKVENIINIEKGNYTLEVYEVGEHLLPLNSNSTVVLDGTVNILGNSFPRYRVFSIFDANNVIVKGGGYIIGDKDVHTYTPEVLDPESPRGRNTSHEFGHGVEIGNSNNISITGISISKCIGDGVCIIGKDVVCKKLKIDNCRRQGIAVLGERILIDSCYITNIWGVNHAGFGIDVEPDDHAYYVTISNCKIMNCNGGINCQSHKFESVQNVDIHDCYLSTFAQDNIEKHDQYRAFICTSSCLININNCQFEDSNNLISITGARDIHITNSRFITRGARYCAYFRDNRGMVHLEKNKFFMYDRRSKTPNGVAFLNLHNAFVVENEIYSENLSRSNLKIDCKNVILKGNTIESGWEPNIALSDCKIENNRFKKKVIIGKIENSTVERNSMPSLRINNPSNSRISSNRLSE